VELPIPGRPDHASTPAAAPAPTPPTMEYGQRRDVGCLYALDSGTPIGCRRYGVMNQMIPIDDIAAASAEARLASGLVYVAGLQIGITRRQGKNGFLYYMPDGCRIVDPAEVSRLNALAIPPAYSDVIISSNPFSHLQAIGTDARGRRQYRYHADWHAERGRAKFERLVDFAHRLPDLRERMDMDLRARGFTMEKALATVVYMLDNLYIRIGNAAYAEANKSYGLTTLRSRHVKVEGGSVKFRFKGKSGKEWNLAHNDPRIAGVVRKLQELPGQHLFQYVCDEGGCRAVTSNDVNSYIREATGQDFSSRQFRTWGATCMAVEALASVEAAATARALARQLNEAIDQVAAKLVNTRSVCRSSYNPAVFEDFRAGRLRDVLKMKTKSERLLQWMDEEEIRVLRWLKTRAATPEFSRTCRNSTVEETDVNTASSMSNGGEPRASRYYTVVPPDEVARPAEN
jgi:DNA topoisomerase-1